MGLTLSGAPCLAIDAGNSKTDVAVVAPDGTVLGSARGGEFQPPRVGVEAAVAALGAAVERAAADAGLPVGGGRRFGQVSACLANADLPREERELAEAVTARGWGEAVHVANDTFALLRAGLPDDGSLRHGVAVVCGAGINCVGRAEDGRVHRFPSVGLISGDWGGGGGLATEALWHAARAEDGRGEPTTLARTLPEHFGLPSMYALIEALHLGEISGGRRYELVPPLFEAARDGDGIALSLVRRQAEEIVSLAVVALTRLGLLETAAPVYLGGGILTSGQALLDDRLAERLAERAPKATAHTVQAPPVLGAGLLALDRVQADEGAHARLRATYGAA
ncbi:ATPase [Streptomyces sp. NBC_01795]|uniref:N-acetylglucosamine kinase n=1 Tax=Streptomyces sp. NBC_01795 TaxID=2975943 RepID=UPI002DDAF37A|nr:BadF/BadG/BcrA/BcrD ATPase family protein [Streptomyces sp. NBC_01795]WSA94736.1 ATPase [Streptomyces sp. NBC_01795]